MIGIIKKALVTYFYICLVPFFVYLSTGTFPSLVYTLLMKLVCANCKRERESSVDLGFTLCRKCMSLVEKQLKK